MMKTVFVIGMVYVVWITSPVMGGLDLSIELLPVESEIEKMPSLSLTDDISKTVPPDIDPLIRYPSGG